MVVTPTHSAEDYAGALRALMPRGRVWPDDPSSVQSQVLHALAASLARLDAAAADLIVDTFPSSAVGLLPEWEDSLGLPDPCLGPNPTIAERQAQAKARFIGNGGQSKAWFIAFAGVLGFQISISEYGAFRTGAGRCGTPLAGEDWVFTWLVTILADASSLSNSLFRAGISRTGDPLSSGAVGRATLECELRRLAPAHTHLLFAA